MCVYELWHNWPIEYIPTHPLLLNNSCIQCGEGGMGMNIFDLSIIPKFIHILPVLYNRAVISAGLFWFLICWASKIRQKGKKSLIFWPKNLDHYWVHVTRYCVEDFFFQMLSRIDLCYFAKFIQISKRIQTMIQVLLSNKIKIKARQTTFLCLM